MEALEVALRDVDYAFRQLEFAIKLMCYCELGHLDRNKFDTDVTIILEQGNIGFSSGNFAEQESIVVASQMLVGTSFGVSAIILDAVYEAAGIEKNINSREPQDDLRILVYMVRCAFAHNLAAPKWEARGQDYAREFNLPLDQGTKIDLTSINGSVFEYDHIGGLSQWYKIKDAVVRTVCGAEQFCQAE